LRPDYYDAVIAAGLGACAAAATGGKASGPDFFSAIVNGRFLGLSGLVEFDNLTGDRNPLSVTYYISNFQRSSNGTLESNLVATWDGFQQVAFTFDTSLPVFKAGQGSPPLDITPPTEVSHVFYVLAVFKMRD